MHRDFDLNRPQIGANQSCQQLTSFPFVRPTTATTIRGRPVQMAAVSVADAGWYHAALRAIRSAVFGERPAGVSRMQESCRATCPREFALRHPRQTTGYAIQAS